MAIASFFQDYQLELLLSYDLRLRSCRIEAFAFAIAIAE